MLIYFTFEAVSSGVCPIECLLVDFRDSWNVQTLPDCAGGTVRVPYCPTPSLPTTWGALKAIYR